MSAPMRPGPRNLITDVAGLKVGNAQDARLKSGSTVLIGDAIESPCNIMIKHALSKNRTPRSITVS